MKKYITLMLIITASILFFSSCSKSSDAKPDNGGLTGKSSYKITYKLILPAKFTGTATYMQAEGAAATVDNLTGTWTSQELTFKKGTAAVLSASASASDGTSGEMTIQILESGKVVKEAKSTGTVLAATADVSLD